MNLLLHGIGGNSDDELPIACRDSLKEVPKVQVDVVLTNPPFGIKGSVTYAQGRKPSRSEDTLTIIRPDFWVQTANKQLNFLQHIVALLKPGGRAAVVIPDNVLFETGAASAIRRRIIETCRVHTLLRLPAGLFYAQGVKSNVLFFEKPLDESDKPVSDRILAYNLRSDKRFSLKAKPLQREDLEEFVTLYRSGFASQQSGREEGDDRFRVFDAEAIIKTSDCRLDLAWESSLTPSRTPGLKRLDEISRLVADDLQRALSLIGSTQK